MRPPVLAGLIALLAGSAQAQLSSSTTSTATSVVPPETTTTTAQLAQVQTPQSTSNATSTSPFVLGTWFIVGTPGEWNTKMRRRFPSFQAAQDIPFALSQDKTEIIDFDPVLNKTYLSNVPNWDDGTDASVFMTIYNYPILANGSMGLDIIRDEDIIRLARRMGAIKDRETFLRWLPEMNGDWMNYGPPTAPEYYVRVWKRMYTIMKQYSPSTKIVWSPNFDLKPGNTEYWPGTDYVDVVGTSVYWKGFGYNNPMPPSYVSDSMATVYNEYAKVYQKPFVISECSAAWESGSGSNPGTGQTFASVTSSIDQVGFQKSFWTEVLSTKLLDSYPLLQAAYIFEDAKQEEFWTDFRVTNDTAVRTMFMGLIDTLDATGRMKWANPLTTTTTTTTTTTRAVSTAVATVISTTTKSGSFIASLGSSALALLACLL